MFAAITYPGLGSTSSRSDAVGLDPGIFAFAVRVFDVVRRGRAETRDAQAAALIAASGGRLSDDVERRIGALWL